MVSQRTGEIIDNVLGRYTQRRGFVVGTLLYVFAGVLLFTGGAVEHGVMIIVIGVLFLHGATLILIGSIGRYLEADEIFQYVVGKPDIAGEWGSEPMSCVWGSVTGAGSIIAGMACLLLPMYQPSFAAFLAIFTVGIGAGFVLLVQGIATIDHSELKFISVSIEVDGEYEELTANHS